MGLRLTTRRRLLAAATAVLSFAVAVGMSAGAASANPVDGSDANGTYLALGDSVAFGYVPPNAVPAPRYLDAHSFLGYPEYVGQLLNERVSNASCPGETSETMLVAGAQSNGCENSPGSPVGYRTLYPLHVQYRGTQMQYALHYLAAHKHTRLVTIDVGANDAFLCQETTADGCTSKAELAGVAAEIAANLGTIFHELRHVAGYQGQIVALSYYSLSYAKPEDEASALFLDGAIEKAAAAYRVEVADGFSAFAGPSAAHDGDPCAAGLLIRLPGGSCNIHPSPAGQQLLAEAIAKVVGG